MSKKIVLAIVLALTCSVTVARDNFQPELKFLPPEELPYNKIKHSINEHASLVAAGYWIIFHLSRKEWRILKEEIISTYSKPLPAIANAKTERERQAMEATRIHETIAEKLKMIVSDTQYEGYKKFANYTEFLLAAGI